MGVVKSLSAISKYGSPFFFFFVKKFTQMLCNKYFLNAIK